LSAGGRFKPLGAGINRRPYTKKQEEDIRPTVKENPP